MGLWDILVPSEAGVLHNLIANPSFEYDNNELDVARLRPPSGGSTVAEIVSFRTLPANTGIMYWNRLKDSNVSRSSSWASRGSYSLKINAGASTNSGVVYDPRLSSPTLVGVSVTVTETTVTPLEWNKIPANKSVSIAVFGLTDTGMALANGISDTQFYFNQNNTDIASYPTMDAKRGHTAPIFASLAGQTQGARSIKVSISGGQNENLITTIRGWAVWYSTDITDTKTYTLASIVPSSASTQLDTSVIIHTIINSSSFVSPTLATGKIYMYPFATNGEYIVKGVGTKFLTECVPDTDLYINTPSNAKQFLGRVKNRGTTLTVSPNTITATQGSKSITVNGTPNAYFLEGRAIYNSSGTLIGIVDVASSSTQAMLKENASVTVSNNVYRFSIDTENEIYLQQKATTTPIGSSFYRMIATNVQSYPDNPIGAISTFQCNPVTNENILPSSMGIDCASPYFGITNNTFANNTYKHHLYLDWYLSSPNLTNPNATYTDTGAQWKVSLVNIVSNTVPVTINSSISIGSTSVTVANASGIVVGDCLYTSSNEFVAEISNVAGTTLTFREGARYAISAPTPTQIKRLPITAGTMIGTLDASTATSLNAKRMGLRTKFLISLPSGDTSRMQLRFQYTGTTSDADLFIDGVQFIDSGMIWRSYDYYSNTSSTYVNPPHFNDWNWDDIEFSYVDGDTPGAIWSDTMPTQSGTYSASFPYFTNDGVWHADFDEYDVSQSAHGMGTPRFRQQYQWRNEAKPVYGVSVPGLSQSSLLTQTFSTGFWASLDTDNINVVVEPTISGTGMPEIATTALEYGITDGGFVQRQVARMRNMQFNVTISAKSWVGLHANRRSLINLLKFDQLAQQGERMLRYTGADTPIVTRITYVGGLEFSGVQTQSFTEVLGIRFLSADPYFYTETPFTQDISPPSVANQSSTVFYKLGNTSEWTPLTFSTNEMKLVSDALLENSASIPNLQSRNPFWDANYAPSIPKAIGWLQSPSGNVSTLVVGGNFSYPFSTIAFFYVSGFSNDTLSSSNKVDFNTGLGTLTVAKNSTTVTFSNSVENYNLIDKFLFVSGDYVGKVISIALNNLSVTLDQGSPTAYTAQPFQIVTVSLVNINSMPTQVYGKQLFQMTGGSALSNASVEAIFQESANSIIVVGDFYQIIDIGDQTPNTNFNTSSVFTAKGKVSTTVQFGNQDISSQYPYFRVARFVMNDNGRIVAYPVDSQFEYDEVSNIYRSRLFNQIGSQSLNAITQSPNGYTFVGGNVNTSIIPLDNTLSNDFAPNPSYRGPFAFAETASQSNVYAINPNIVSQNAINSLEFSGSVGYRLGVTRFGLLSTFPNSLTQKNLVQVSPVDDQKPENISRFTTNDIGKLIFTDVGLYVGQIYAIPGGLTDSVFAILAQPALVEVTDSGFMLLGDIKSLTTDKKTNSSTLFAVVNSANEQYLNFRSSLYAYVPSPRSAGKMSFFEGSKSVAIIGSTFDNTLSINTSGSIACSTDSDKVYGDGTSFTPGMVGNTLLTKSGAYIGEIKLVLTSNELQLTRNAFVDVGLPPNKLPPLQSGTGFTGFIATNTGRPAARKILSGSIKSGQEPTLVAGKIAVGDYLYLYYPKKGNQSVLAQFSGIVESFINSPPANTPKTITLTTSSRVPVIKDRAAVIDGNKYYTYWFTSKAETKIFDEYNMISNRIFTDSDGYVVRAGQLESVPSSSTILPSAIGVLRSPSSFTSSTTQLQGTNYNAYSMYTAQGSNTAIVNFDSLSEDLILNSAIRRQFNLSSSVKATAYDPTISSDSVTGFGDVFASYSFGAVQPIMPTGSENTGTLTIRGVSITTGQTFTVSNSLYVVANNRIVFLGVIASGGQSLVSNNFGNGTFTTWYLINTASVSVNANSTKLVKGPGTYKAGGSGTGTQFSQFDVGRSLYVKENDTYYFVGIIKSRSSNTSITTTSEQYTWQGNLEYYLSGGSPVSSNNNVAWYPYQFAYTGGGNLYEYLSGEAFGMESSSSPFTTVSGTTVRINLNNQTFTTNTPQAIASNEYALYAYISGIDSYTDVREQGNTETIKPSYNVGQWYYIGLISQTGSYTIDVPLFTSNTTFSIASGALSGTLSASPSPNAYQLVGCAIFNSSGMYVGVVSSAQSTTAFTLQNNALVTASNSTLRYMYNLTYNSDNNRGIPLSIVHVTRIQTQVPESYSQNEELYTYSDAYDNINNPSLQYLGTIQKVISTSNNVATISYMPYWATPKTLLDSSSTYIAGDDSSNIRGSSTVLKASKSLKATSLSGNLPAFAPSNYFADVIGVVSGVAPNNYNRAQTATIGFDGAADVFNSVVPSISQVEPIVGTTVTASTTNNTLSLSTATTTIANGIAVNPSSGTYTLTGTPNTIQNKSIFRNDGQYMGSSTTAGTTGTLSPFNVGNGDTLAPFSYMNYSGSVTIDATSGSAIATLSGGTLLNYAGKAIFAAASGANAGKFLGIVDYVYSTNGIKFLDNASISYSGAFAFANAFKENTISITQGVQTGTIRGMAFQYPNVYNELANKTILKILPAYDNPFEMTCAHIESVTRNASTNTFSTPISPRRGTTGFEPYIHMTYSGTANTIAVTANTTTISFAGTAPSNNVALFFAVNAGDGVNSTFIGIKRDNTLLYSNWVPNQSGNKTAVSYFYMSTTQTGVGTFSVRISSASTTSNIVTTTGSGIPLSTFIGHAIFVPGTPTSNITTDPRYKFIGIVKDVGTNQLILTENALSNITTNTVIMYAPSTVPIQIATSNMQRTEGFNRITSVNGQSVVEVYGQPDAYTLSGNNAKLYTISGNGIPQEIGTVQSANSPTEAVLGGQGALTSYNGAYQYESANSISTVATLTNAPISQFGSNVSFWKTDGTYMGISGEIISSTNSSFHFSNIPYSNTNNTNQYFIWADGNMSNNNIIHYLAYGTASGNTLTVAEGDTIATIAGSEPLPSSLIGSALYSVNVTYIGRVASVDNNQITLLEPAKLSNSSTYYYAPNPHLLMFHGTPSATANVGRIVNLSFIDSAVNKMSTIISPMDTLQGTLGHNSSIRRNNGVRQYTYVDSCMKYTMIPGDVVRSGNDYNISNKDIIGQIVGFNITAMSTISASMVSRSLISHSGTARIHRKQHLSEFIGIMQGNVTQKITIGGIGGTRAYIYGNNTKFTAIPVDFLNKSSVNNGTGFYLKDTRNFWVNVGTIYQVISDTLLIVTLSATSISDFANKIYSSGYVVRSTVGLGVITISSSGIVRQADSNESNTIFTEQLYHGCVITVYDPTTLVIDGQYRVIDILSYNKAIITDADGSPYSGGLKSERFFTIQYVYDEYPLIDRGLPTSANLDWQPMGLTDGAINNITTTENGSIIISGDFTSWIDASYVGTLANYNSVKRNVGRVAKITPLIANGEVFDTYASPIIGNSYTQNGFNSSVNVVQDITDVNPINGYVGSGDKLMIGGGFTATLNGESVSHSIAYAEGSTISGNLQTVVNSDLILPVYRDSLNSIASETVAIASTNRIRKYSTNPITNVLDGITGSNVAIIHKGYINNVYTASTITSKMQYFSLRVRGNASVYPVIRIRNGGVNKKIYELYQTETGARIRFDKSGLTVLAYEEITINLVPGQRSITSNIRGNMIAFINPTSNFVDWILLGANNSAGKYTQSYDDYRINVIGIHAQNGMVATISYTPRFWSFDANNMFFGTTKAGL